MAIHIQIGDISPRIQYTGNGSQTVFTYPFPIFTAADMEVWLDNVKQSTGFTVGTEPLWRIEQDTPLPFTLLSVSTEINING